MESSNEERVVKYYCPICGEEFEHHDIDDPYEIVCFDDDVEGYHECVCLRCDKVLHRAKTPDPDP